MFEDDAHFSAKTFGVPKTCPVIVPDCFSNKTPAEIHKMVDDTMPKVIEGLTRDRNTQKDLPQFDRRVLDDTELGRVDHKRQRRVQAESQSGRGSGFMKPAVTGNRRGSRSSTQRRSR